jgi:hypothetical protein
MATPKDIRSRIAKVHNDLKLRESIINKFKMYDYYEVEALDNNFKEYIGPILVEAKIKHIQSITTRLQYLEKEDELYFKHDNHTDEELEKRIQRLYEIESLQKEFKKLTKQNKLNKLTTLNKDEYNDKDYDDEQPPAKKQMAEV